MQPEFTVSGRIAKPVAEVFEAIADPEKLSSYFTTGGAVGRLEEGRVVTWDFHDFPGAVPVTVAEVLPNELIVVRWRSAVEGAPDTTVTFAIEQLADGRTLVRISESGWAGDAAGIKAAFGNCEGWTGMLCAMKMWLEHGIKLREGFYK